VGRNFLHNRIAEGVQHMPLHAITHELGLQQPGTRDGMQRLKKKGDSIIQRSTRQRFPFPL
jgi:hypothetical protein